MKQQPDHPNELSREQRIARYAELVSRRQVITEARAAIDPAAWRAKRNWRKPKPMRLERFGKIAVLRELDRRSVDRIAECRCDCGAVFTAIYRNVITKNTKSCGCRKKRTGTWRTYEWKAWQNYKWHHGYAGSYADFMRTFGHRPQGHRFVKGRWVSAPIWKEELTRNLHGL